MLSRLVLSVVLLVLAALPLRAETRGLAALVAALDLERLISVMSREGGAYGDDLAAELFPDSAGPRWRGVVAQIHDPARMMSLVVDVLDREVVGHADVADAATAFLSGDPGERIVALELAAREALLDEGTQEAAELAFEQMQASGAPRVLLLDRFVQANDLVESNVSGALNANLAFYRGMIAGGGMEPLLAEGDMLSDLWAQEPQIREETLVWLYPYLAMAYDDLSDEDLQTYIDFSRSPPGQWLNRALSTAFDAMFSALSYDLGLAVAKHLQGQDI